jgi:3-deoxy-D-manno-octulosonic-acid transferase
MWWTSLYNTTVAIFSPLIAVGLLSSKRGRIRWQERFGSWKIEEKKPVVWFHGASLGEVRGLLPVLKLFRQRHPELSTLLTCTSPTGLDAAKGQADHCHLLPIDSSVFLSPALKNITIRALILSETELWPGLVAFAVKRRSLILLINGRISDSTLGRYKKLGFIMKEFLPSFARILASSNQTRDRFIAIGASPQNVLALGNSKYDGIYQVGEGEREEFRARFNLYSFPVICLGSIRDGEQNYWFPALRKLRQEGLQFHVIVAPRHREKFEYFARSLLEHDLPFMRYTHFEVGAAKYASSVHAAPHPHASGPQVLLLDTYGKLLEAYAVSDLAFIGATLVNIGGHNPFEAVAQNCAVIVGPYVQNIREEVKDLNAVTALTSVKNTAEIEAAILTLVTDLACTRRKRLSGAAAWNVHQGSALRIVEQIDQELVAKTDRTKQ